MPGHPLGTWRIGSIAGVDVLVRASWLAVALLIAVALAPRIEQAKPGLGALAYVAGLAFAVLLYLSVLLHEVSHAVAARRFGLPVRSITLHFLGGATEIDDEAPTPWSEFVIAVVGPLTSLAVGVASLGLWAVLPDGLLRLAFQGLCAANLVVGVLNLVPGLPLDGGRVLRAAYWWASGDPHRASVVAAYAGRVVAVLVLGWPVLESQVLGRTVLGTDFLMTLLIAWFLWSGASAALTQARLRQRLPALRARTLARRVIVVPEDLPLAEAVRRAQEAEAGGIATETSDRRITGLVDESALASVPVERRPWIAVSNVTRTLDEGLLIPADSVGEELVRAMTRAPASEYLLVETDGGIFGLLAAADVERAFAAGR